MSDGTAAPSRASIAYPDELRDRELALIRTRRAAAGLPGELAAPALATGLALSGGGIRSATFGLGVLQALARQRLLHRVDYVSTVSGGGYVGSFLGRLFTRDAMTAAEVERTLAQETRPEVLRHLRENGRYLSPQGAGDLLLDGAVLFRNWVALCVVVFVSLLAVFLGIETLKRAAHLLFRPAYEAVEHGLNAALPLGFSTLWWSTWTAVPLALAAVAVLPLGIAYWLRRWGAVLLLCAGLALAVLQGRAPLSQLSDTGRVLLFAVPLSSALFFLCAQLLASDRSVLAHESELRNRLSRWLKVALFSTCALLAFAIVDSVGQTLHLAIATSLFDGWASWLMAAIAGLVTGAGVARRVTVAFARQPIGRRPAPKIALVSSLGALVVTLVLLTIVSTAAHAIAAAGAPVHTASPWLQLPATARHVVLFDEDPRVGAGLELALVHGQVPATAGVGWARDIARSDLYAPLLALAIALAACLFFGRSWRFLTRSSHHPLYSARLTRAYLGASNPERLRHEISVTQVVPDDDIELRDYYAIDAADGKLTPAQKGAPLHLINVTINETVDGRSHVQQQDRKGTGLAVGPCGLSVGVRHHAVLRWSEPTTALAYPDRTQPHAHRVFTLGSRHPYKPELLSLGQWVAISGAAFSTGLGARTSLGLSLLAGLTNIRLGYWWDAGLPRMMSSLERVFPVQTYLLRELLARFSGTASARWYLSDGGHFENMGGYELVRRKLQRIVIVDAEADPEYTFEGLANLIRKARLDFGAEITFLTERELDARVHPSARRWFGTLEQLRRGGWTTTQRFGDGKVQELPSFADADDTLLSIAHAALAEVVYADAEAGAARGLILYLKPTLTGGEPADLTHYHAAHPPFPQETTADQFFDEAQWESYRKLGDHIATALFTAVDGGASAAAPAGTTGRSATPAAPAWTPRDLLA